VTRLGIVCCGDTEFVSVVCVREYSLLLCCRHTEFVTRLNIVCYCVVDIQRS